MSFDGINGSSLRATVAACATPATVDVAARTAAEPKHATPAHAHACRFCREPQRHTFVDFGMSPLCESFLAREQLDAMESFYPLCAFLCERCLLVQLPQYVSAADIFSEYAYFSSY